MKLLFDQNLSPRLVFAIGDLFGESKHVQDVGLGNVPDARVWEYAKQNGFTIVSKDSDFSDLAAVRRSPPKVICINLGNCSTGQIESLLRMRASAIVEFGNSDDDLLLLP